jgi:hypothetical protein
MKNKKLLVMITAFLLVFGNQFQPAEAASQYGDVTINSSVPAAGTYRVWSRIKAPDSTNNSFTLQINGGTAETVGDFAIAAGTWTWVDYRNGSLSDKLNVSLGAGNAAIVIGGREPDVQVDRILLLSDGCIPADTGDNCTAATPMPPPPAVSVPYRVNAGGPAYTDPQGNAWSADTYGTGGEVDSQADGIAIANTTADTVYQSERWGLFSYKIPVTNGTYRIRLHFAEIYNGCFVAGCRVFSVASEGQAKVSNLDIFKEAGQYAALVKEFDQPVSDGELTLDFNTAAANSPKVSAIEVLSPDAQTPVFAPEDINLDGSVDILDFSLLSAKFGQTTNLGRADINQDGRVNIIDFSLLAAKFGS